MRAFVEKEITPFCNQWDEAKKIPRELFVKAYEARRAARRPQQQIRSASWPGSSSSSSSSSCAGLESVGLPAGSTSQL